MTTPTPEAARDGGRRRSVWQDRVDDALRERAGRERRRPSPAEVRDAVMEVCGVELQRLCSRDRGRDVVHARELFVVAAHEWCGLSYPELSRWLGRRNHSTAWCAGHRWLSRAAPDREIEMATVRSRVAARRGVPDDAIAPMPNIARRHR